MIGEQKRGINYDNRHEGLRKEHSDERLKRERDYAKISFTDLDLQAYAEMQLMLLKTQEHYWLKVLGRNPKRCENCGGEI